MSDTLTNALAQSAHSQSVLAGIQNPAVVNPLAGMGSAISAVSSMQGLQEKQAQQLAGQAYQGAINQETGEFDPNKFRTLLAQSGSGAAMAAGAALLNTQQISSDQLKQSLDKQKWINSTSGALLQAGDFSDAAMLGALHNGVAGHILTLPEAQAQLATMPPDAAGRQRWLQVHQDTSASFAEQMQQRFGTTGSQTGPGGSTIGFTQQPARAGGGISAPPQAGAPQGLTPAEATTPTQTGVTPSGAPVSGTRQQFIDQTQGGGPLGTGRPLPPALRGPNAPAATAGPPGVVTGQGPAATAAQGATGTASAGKFQDIVAQGVAARSQDALLATMLSEAQGFRPGPGADLAATVKRTILGLGAQFGTTFGVDTDKLAKQESVAKIANQLADAQGAGSDARLRVNEGANPSLHNTPAGLDLIIRQLRGNTDYLRVRQRLAAAYPDKADVEGFESKVGANLDPRVFQYERLQPSQRRDYFQGLTDKDAFIKAHDWAAQQKLLGGGGG